MRRRDVLKAFLLPRLPSLPLLDPEPLRKDKPPAGTKSIRAPFRSGTRTRNSASSFIGESIPFLRLRP